MCIASAGLLTLRCSGLVIYWPSTQPLHVRSRRSSSSRSRRLHVHHEYVSCRDLQIHVLSHRFYVRSGSYSFGSIIGGRGLAWTVWRNLFFLQRRTQGATQHWVGIYYCHIVIAQHSPIAKPKVKVTNLNNRPFGGPGLPGDVKVVAFGRNAVRVAHVGLHQKHGGF